MPARLSFQVLHHDAREHDDLGVDVVEDLAVREIEPVGDVGGDPCWEKRGKISTAFPPVSPKYNGGGLSEMRTEILMRCERIHGGGSVMLVNLVEPCDASCVILWS